MKKLLLVVNLGGKSFFGHGLPDFYWHNLPKREKYTKLSQSIPIDRKIDQTAIKFTNISNCKTIQNLQKSVIFGLKKWHLATLHWAIQSFECNSFIFLLGSKVRFLNC
jgi:hypothetical protein